MYKLATLSQIILLKDILIILQQAFDELFIPTTHGEVQSSSFFWFWLKLKVLCDAVMLIDIEDGWADRLEQFVAELDWQLDHYFALGSVLPKSHQLQ